MSKEARSFKIQEIAHKFWDDASLGLQYPIELRKLEQAILAQFPISIVKLNDLNLSAVSNYLNQRGIFSASKLDDRELFGFILCHGNNTFIFLNGVESSAEQLFTLAHEFSHFLFDFWLPRGKLIAQFGTSICEALDGKRPFTVVERTKALTAGFKLTGYTHLLDAPLATASHTLKVWHAEEDADQLALELLAPFRAVRELVYSMKADRSYKNLISLLVPILQSNFNLPLSVARSYAPTLSKRICGGISLKEKWNIK